jgi:hypothetical protein
MLQLRARGFALRDAFPDILRGLVTAEEAQDYQTARPQPALRVTQPKPAVQRIQHVEAEAIDCDVEHFDAQEIEAEARA